MRIPLGEKWSGLPGVAKASAEEQDLFEWWSNIWLPAFLGIVTLALAAASVYVAFQSHRTSMRAAKAAERANLLTRRYQDEERRQKTLRARRRIGGPLTKDYLRSAMLAMTGTPEKGDQQLDQEIRELAVEVDDQGGLNVLKLWLSKSIEAIRKRHAGEPVHLDGPESLDPEVLENIDLIREWERDPDAVDAKIRSRAYIHGLLDD